MLDCGRSYILLLMGLILGLGANHRLVAAIPSTKPTPAHVIGKEGQSVKYMITVQEDRESTDRQLPKPSSLSLKRNLHLSLKALPRESNGFHKIQCKFERIELNGQFDDQPIHYDSDRDQPGKGNAIADLLSNIVGVKFHISITPEGVFKQLSGLDATWRAKGLLIAPAPMLGIQFLFRDQAMLQLLTATLSPPLPPDTSIKGFTYQHWQPVEIPFVALLVWPATFTITGNERINGETCVHIIAKGDIKTARLPGDIGKAGLRASVVKGHRQTDLYISPDAREVIRNEITHKLALSVKLNPPAGGDSPIMDLRQQIRIVATRLKY